MDEHGDDIFQLDPAEEGEVEYNGGGPDVPALDIRTTHEIATRWGDDVSSASRFAVDSDATSGLNATNYSLPRSMSSGIGFPLSGNAAMEVNFGGIDLESMAGVPPLSGTPSSHRGSSQVPSSSNRRRRGKASSSAARRGETRIDYANAAFEQLDMDFDIVPPNTALPALPAAARASTHPRNHTAPGASPPSSGPAAPRRRNAQHQQMPAAAAPAAPPPQQQQLPRLRDAEAVRAEEPHILSPEQTEIICARIRAAADMWFIGIDRRDPIASVNNAGRNVTEAVDVYLRNLAATYNAVRRPEAGAEGVNLNEANCAQTMNGLIWQLEDDFDSLRINSALPADTLRDLHLMKLQAIHGISSCFGVFSGVVELSRRDFSDQLNDSISRYDYTHPSLENKPIMVLKMKIADELKRVRAKRGDIPRMLYKQQFVNGHGTRFWKPWKTMLDFINEFTSTAQMDMYCWVALNNKTLHNSVITWLGTCAERDVSTVKPTQGVYSLSNGILNGLDNTFTAYDNPNFAIKYPPSFCTYNLFPRSPVPIDGYHPITGHYDWGTYGMPYHETGFQDVEDKAPEGHWSTIHVPFLTPFMQAQGWNWSVCSDFCMALGRYQFPILDGLQFAIMLLGEAGLGKSSIMDFLKCCFPAEYHGQVMVNCEPIFGQADFLDSLGRHLKHICFTSDFDGKINLDLNTINSQVSNESSYVAVKKEGVRRTEKWTAGWMILANGFFRPESISQLGPLLRRWLIWRVSQQPIGPPPTTEGFQLAMGHFLKVTILAYHEKIVRKFDLMRLSGMQPSTWIWSHISPYFTEQRNNVLKETHGIVQFFLDSNWFERSGRPGSFMTVESIRHAYRAYKAFKDKKTLNNVPIVNHTTVRAYLTLVFPGTNFLVKQPSNEPLVDSFSRSTFTNEAYIVDACFAPNNQIFSNLIKIALPDATTDAPQQQQNGGNNFPSSTSVAIPMSRPAAATVPSTNAQPGGPGIGGSSRMDEDEIPMRNGRFNSGGGARVDYEAQSHSTGGAQRPPQQRSGVRPPMVSDTDMYEGIMDLP